MSDDFDPQKDILGEEEIGDMGDTEEIEEEAEEEGSDEDDDEEEEE